MKITHVEDVARLRRDHYPPLEALADALYWQNQGDPSKMAAYLLAVEAVKQRFPKLDDAKDAPSG